MTHDLLVVGGGLVGSCVAGFLAAEGARVVLLDDGRTGGSNANAGSLHVQMQSRFMRLYPENVPGMERQLPLYPRAVRFWQAFEKELGTDFELRLSGGLMVAETEEQLRFLAAKAERERALGLDVELLDRDALRTLAPALSRDLVGAELCRDEGKLNPLAVNAAVRRWGRAAGVDRRDGVRVSGLSRDGSGFVAATDGGEVRADRLVLAAAAGTRALAAMLGVAVPADPEPLHMNITEPTAPMLGQLVQHADRMITLKQLASGQVVIGGGWPAALSGARDDPRVLLNSMVASATLARHVVPSLAPLRIIRTWAGINTTVDGRGVLGPVASVPGLFVAVPGDAGYTLGPLSARAVADAVLDHRPAIDLSDYSPDRFAA